MSSSIPIPARPPNSPRPDASLLGSSLPTLPPLALHTPHSVEHGPVVAPRTSQDDLATISPWHPSVELVSRAARKWQSHHPLSLPPSPMVPKGPSTRGGLPSGFPTGPASPPPPSTPPNGPSPSHRPSRLRFDPWDFSEVVNASLEVRTAFESGSARATRPPRDGVSGTYFIRRNESHGDVLCVFKPVDEEATSIDLSPVFAPIPVPPNHPATSASNISLGPAHAANPSFPFARSPPAPQHLSLRRTSSSSSESEAGSRNVRASGFNTGEGAYKEVAAYLLDHDRFARVPQTALARCHFMSDLPEKKSQDGRSGKSLLAGSVSDDGNFLFEDGHDSEFDDDHDQEFCDSSESGDRHSHMRTKMGAFQVFMPNIGDADDFGPGVFDKDQVHRIAVLDIRTLNHDRHGGNILVAKSNSPERRYDLIPIDHGYILPEVIQGVPWPVWMDWPMARRPVSEEVKIYVEFLDADKEAHILSEELDGVLRPGSLQALKIATALLQKGIAAGLTLYDIGLLMYIKRDDPMEMSELQKIVAEAMKVGEARERHLSEAEDDTSRGMPEDHHHRRHQSMSAINTHEAYVDDFIVKYAVRRIQDVVARVAAEKEKEMNRSKSPSSTGGARQPPTVKLPRARSIPDFGIGVKPVHALFTRSNSNGAPAPTPVSSPNAAQARSRHEIGLIDEELTSLPRPAVRQPTVQIPINDMNMMRIRLPESRTPSNGSMGRLSSGSIPVATLPPHETVASSGDLPPLFKRGSSERKSSPVAPMDLVQWNGGSP